MNTDETITIYDVAREAGVSMATVSRVVNGNKNVKAQKSSPCERSIPNAQFICQKSLRLCGRVSSYVKKYV